MKETPRRRSYGSRYSESSCQSIQHHPFIETIAMSNVDIMEVTESLDQPMAQIDMREIRKQQHADTVLGVMDDGRKGQEAT